MAGAVAERVLIEITAEPLSAERAVAFVADATAGGTCVFLGTVRDHSEGGDVTGLTYEAWDELATVRLRGIADEILEKWSLVKVAILHRKGKLGIGDVSVVIACSAPHRAEAFEACRYAIERLKHDVPIWKKESLASGEAHWVMGS